MFSSVLGYAQKEYTISSQKDRLRQYAGQWVSSINPISDSLALFPEIKMSSLSNFNNNSLTVSVLQKNDNNQYKPLLYEIIGYDTKTDIIFASGHDSQGTFFTGRGQFLSEKQWVMQDKDLNNNPTMQVHFNFQKLHRCYTRRF